MENSFVISVILPARPEKIYKAWLSSEGHTAFTGSEASIDGGIGGKFSTWEGYITGETIELEPYRRILQNWRTSEFPADSPDSSLEILFEEVEEGTRLTLVHNNIPEGQADDYYQGWIDFYFTPMQKYFKG